MRVGQVRFDWLITPKPSNLPIRMSAELPQNPPLAPLQRLMLRDSLADGTSGHHVEQVEIVFAPGPARCRIPDAWIATVNLTAALQRRFLTDGAEALGSEPMTSVNDLTLCNSAPESLAAWLALDRTRPLLIPHQVPWRASYWPEEGRFIWTFHHALLDGRSITRILSDFFRRIAGNEVAGLTIARWRNPSPETIALASDYFREKFAGLEPIQWIPNEDPQDSGSSVLNLTQDISAQLESYATSARVTVPALLIWAWGQALMRHFETSRVVVEQLRAGTPQDGAAGFTMNTLPILIPLADPQNTSSQLLEFRNELIALRSIETVSAEDFPPTIFPNTQHISSSVIMIERGTLQHLTGISSTPEMVESLTLHEAPGETLMATAHLLPDLRLTVEGPEKKCWLDRWVCEIENLITHDATMRVRGFQLRSRLDP